MSKHSDEEINLLQSQLNRLVDQQVRLQKEISNLQLAINRLSATDMEKSSSIPAEKPAVVPSIEEAQSILPSERVVLPKFQQRPILPKPKKPQPTFLDSIDWERFLGENLVSKIGILILIIGVAIGAKYAIDNQVVSPLVRIICGYLAGIALVATSFRLKEKYQEYSAVLLSGGLTILYFITYLAYSLYSLLPQPLAFALMVVFTAFTVLASLRYNQMLIALLGMVGAYAVPFLLSKGNGQVHILFIYMLIINIGILVLAFYRQWKVLLYAAFGLTWLIFLTWFIDHNFVWEPEQTSIAAGFATAFFLLFYAALLAYPLMHKEIIEADLAILIPVNGLIYFGVGLYLLDIYSGGSNWLGAFALLNGLLHLLVAVIVKKRRASDKTLTYLVIGMVFLFVSLAVPLQLDGYPVTLIWIGEAVLLLWVARKQGIRLYERSAYILVIVAFLSLLEDWYQGISSATPAFINLRFLTGMLFSIALGILYYLFSTRNKHLQILRGFASYQAATYVLPSILLITLYFTPWLELDHFWSGYYQEGMDDNWLKYRFDPSDELSNLSTTVYSLWFFIVFVLISLKFLKNGQAQKLASLGLLLSIGYFMLMGLYTLAELRELTIQSEYNTLISRIDVQLYRIFALISLGISLAVAWHAVVRKQVLSIARRHTETGLAVIIVWLLSSELIDVLSWNGSVNTYRFGLTVLWGICALVLVALGMFYRKKHLRILAFALFGVSLVKVFFYDLAQMETLGRTVVLVALGVLLLLVSFLYNKNKHLFADEIPPQKLED
jgi:uncharacterized membrane protein